MIWCFIILPTKIGLSTDAVHNSVGNALKLDLVLSLAKSIDS